MYANRIDGFVGAVQNYQTALLEYRDAIRSNGALRSAARQKAHIAFNKMQRGFRDELMAVSARNGALNKNPLGSYNKAIQVARSRRSIAKLNVMSQAQANGLVKYAKYTKFLGNGLTIVDFTSRAGDVYNSFQAGGRWERELFIESSSFISSVGAGTAVLKVGGAALAFTAMLTPIGWVGLIIEGTAVVGLAAGASVGMNRFTKENSGSWYDAIMDWLT